MKKLLLAMLMLLMTLSLVACKAEEPVAEVKDVTLKVWGAQEDQEMLTSMIEEFKTAHPEANWTIELGVVGEPDARTKYLEDPEAAADVFAFPNDQVMDLVNAGALYEVTINKDAIVAANIQSAVDSATVDGKLYGYPMTADNGYFMYYDKSVFTEEDVKSFDKMLEVAGAAGKSVFMDVSNGWYIASFFIGAGNKFEVVDGKQVLDFNNETGVKVGEAIKAITANPAYLTGDDNVLKAGIGTTIAAGVSGTWNAGDIATILGDNYAATKLPTFNLGGVETQMGSFAGFKLMGVNSLTMFPEEAMALAEFLTNEANQVKRFETRKLGPANKNAAQNAAVLADVALSALAQQAPFAMSQNSVAGTYWGPAEAFGLALENKDYTMSIQEMLDALVSQAAGE
ncbi:MAG TPA: extracellular solute-binding protein [Erysipelotrichaceae bacterium]|nr:extracellular solute-binding protein [Erysipelotrichaceae bacterium]